MASVNRWLLVEGRAVKGLGGPALGSPRVGKEELWVPSQLLSTPCSHLQPPPR